MRKIRGNVVGTNMSPEKVAKRLPIDDTLKVEGAPADAKAVGDGIAHIQEELAKIAQGGGGATEVYAAGFDMFENMLSKGSFYEMVDAFQEGKVVTLGYTNPVSNKFCFYCTHYDTGYESEEHLEFVGNEYGGYSTICVYPDGRVTKNTIAIGDIETALDGIIAIQNSLIGGGEA